MNRTTRIWVSKDFKKKLKKDAIENNMSVLELTERLAKDEKIKKGWGKHGFKL